MFISCRRRQKFPSGILSFTLNQNTGNYPHPRDVAFNRNVSFFIACTLHDSYKRTHILQLSKYKVRMFKWGDQTAHCRFFRRQLFYFQLRHFQSTNYLSYFLQWKTLIFQYSVGYELDEYLQSLILVLKVVCTLIG